MKRTFAILAVIGTILPNFFVVRESIETGNYMLYTSPVDTFKAMFATNISSAFVTDLLFIVVLFLWWSYIEARKLKMKNVWAYWIYTFVLGLAGGLPLFLYFREKRSTTGS